jgi:hypothetical protein
MYVHIITICNESIFSQLFTLRKLLRIITKGAGLESNLGQLTLIRIQVLLCNHVFFILLVVRFLCFDFLKWLLSFFLSLQVSNDSTN